MKIKHRNVLPKVYYTIKIDLENWQFQIFKRHYVYFVGESKVRTNYNYMYDYSNYRTIIIVSLYGLYGINFPKIIVYFKSINKKKYINTTERNLVKYIIGW